MATRAPERMRPHLQTVAAAVDRLSGRAPLGAPRPWREPVLRRLLYVGLGSAPVLLGMFLGAVGFCHDEQPQDGLFGFTRWLEFVRYKSSALHDWKLQLALAAAVHLYNGVAAAAEHRRTPGSGGNGDGVLSAAWAALFFAYSLVLVIFQPQALSWGVKSAYFDVSLFLLLSSLVQRYLTVRQAWGSGAPRHPGYLIGGLGALSLGTAVVWFWGALDGEWFIVDQALARGAAVAVVACPGDLAGVLRGGPAHTQSRSPLARRLLDPSRSAWIYHGIFLPLACLGLLSPSAAVVMATTWIAWTKRERAVASSRERVPTGLAGGAVTTGRALR